jgi:hypothetical protein
MGRFGQRRPTAVAIVLSTAVATAFTSARVTRTDSAVSSTNALAGTDLRFGSGTTDAKVSRIDGRTFLVEGSEQRSTYLKQCDGYGSDCTSVANVETHTK